MPLTLKDFWAINPTIMQKQSEFLPIQQCPPGHTTNKSIVGYLRDLVVYEISQDDLTNSINDYLAQENVQLIDTIQDLEAQVINLELKLQEVASWT